MSKIEKRVAVNGSLERLFTYVPEVERSPEIWPGLLEAGEVQRLPLGGVIARWIYKTTGLLFEELDERVEGRGMFAQFLRRIEREQGDIACFCFGDLAADYGTVLIRDEFCQMQYF